MIKMTLKAKDAAVNEPMPKNTIGLKVITEKTKDRTFRGTNFPSKKSWRDVLREPQKKRD